MRGNRLAIVVAAMLTWSCNAMLGPSAPSENWRVQDFARFSLYVRPGSFCDVNAAAIDRVLEDQYSFVLTALDAHLDRQISGFLFESATDANRLSDRSGTAYVQTGAFNAVCSPPLDDNLFALVQHESNHVIQGSVLGRPGTYFLAEGLASAIISERYHRLGRTFLFAWTRDRRAQIPPIADLMDDDKWKTIDQRTAYNAAAAFLAYVLETYGPRPLKAIWSTGSDSIADRVRSAYGKPLQDLEAEWLRFCATFSALS